MEHGAARGGGVTVRVNEMRWEAEGVVSLLLDGAERPAWDPGAHVTLNLPSGRSRQYSLCGTDGAYRIAVLDVPGGRGGSREIHRLRPGQMLDVGPPVNRFELVDAESYLFVAGGIGITPILPMIRRVAASGRSWKLVYGGRSRAGMAFLDELETLRAGGIDVPSSCEQGICGTCETRVLSGRPDHRDALLTDAEREAGDTMMVCVSRCLDDELVLDL
jgi:ferredoxin-NADP reductase